MNDKLNQPDPKVRFSIIVFAVPLVAMLLIMILKEFIFSIDSVLLFGTLFIINTILLLLFYHESGKKDSLNEGYLLLFLLVMEIFSLILFIHSYLIDLNIFYSTVETLIPAIQLAWGLSFISFLLYFFSFVSQSIIVLIYSWLHKTALELRYDSNFSLEVKQNESQCTIKELSFISFNRYLKVQSIWVLIPLVAFPISFNFRNITNLSSFSTILLSIGFIILLLSAQFGLIHYRNLKANMCFILTTNEKNTEIGLEEKIPIKKYFVNDLLSFFKIGLLFALTSKLVDIYNLFSTIGNNIDILLACLVFFALFSLFYLIEIIILFFIQFIHFYLISNEKIRFIGQRIWNAIEGLFKSTVAKIEKIDERIISFRKYFKEQELSIRKKICIHIFINPFTYLLEAILVYLGVTIVCIELGFFIIGVFLLVVFLLYFSLISFPFVVLGSIYAYYKVKKLHVQSNPPVENDFVHHPFVSLS